MRRTCARVLAVVVVAGLISSPASAGPINVDYVDGSGREWASLVETGDLSWNQVSEACPQDGLTACASNIGTIETAGWIWATRDQVRDLFYDLGVSSGGLDDYLYDELDSSFAPLAVSAFSPTQSTARREFVFGWTATLDTSDIVDRGYVGGIFDYLGSAGALTPDAADLTASGFLNNHGPSVGAWLYRDSPAQATPVPEPASMLLLGTGLAGLVAHRRRRSRT